MLKDEKDMFVLGHPEYFKDTLKLEYERDLNLGLKIKKPCNYFKKNSKISYSWRCDANNIFANWLNYSVYQATPYDIE